ncbi:MAG: VCBS repeat-containing protein, partial [Gammaproteobacteria bacterium]|nr:VCBS repeat-containing protein [Gammaproteobacteria bacterium]
MAEPMRRTAPTLARTILCAAALLGAAHAAEPGLPFTEDFSADTLLGRRANVQRDTDTQRLLMAFGKRGGPVNGFPDGDVPQSLIGRDTDPFFAVSTGDFNNDGLPDVAMANSTLPNRIYLNTGTATPFDDVVSIRITDDADQTNNVAVGDVNGDGFDDVIALNGDTSSKLYLHNGTADPFAGVTAIVLNPDTDSSFAAAIGDIDGDGDMDIVLGNGGGLSGGVNRLLLNDGNPVPAFTSSTLTGDVFDTRDVQIADMDADGDLDVVCGNIAQSDRLYLNNGSATPFSGVAGSDIGTETVNTGAIALGDLNNDGAMDIVAGNGAFFGAELNRYYLNNGTADPFLGVAGLTVSASVRDTQGIALADVDGDGDLDIYSANSGDGDEIHLNQIGSGVPEAFSARQIPAPADFSTGVALADFDNDGDVDAAVSNLIGRPAVYYEN